MQMLQPEMQRLKEKYKGRKDAASRQAQNEEMMALYKEHKANPFSSCMPILLQMPIFFALFRVLANTGNIAMGTYVYDHLGPLDATLADQIEKSSLFGAPLSGTFMTATENGTRVIIMIMVLAMAASQFFSMRQLMMKNMPKSAVQDDANPAIRTQKMMMWMMPAMLAVSGVYFQIGVLLYWFTTNIWSLGQQYYTIERMPAPGSDAWAKREAKHKVKYEAYREKVEAEYAPKLAAAAEEGPEAIEKLELEKAETLRKRRVKLELERERAPRPTMGTGEEQAGPRIQPNRKSRSQRKAQGSGENIVPQPQGKNAAKDETKDSDEDAVGKERPGANLTPEEIARRRYERRAAERQRRQQRKGKKRRR